MLLFGSQRVNGAAFDSPAFGTLFKREKNDINNNGSTMLMHLCKYSPQLLNKEFWFLSELLEQAKKRNAGGVCALMILLASNPASEVDFSQMSFESLLAAENDITDENGLTVLMYLCQFNPRLLS